MSSTHTEPQLAPLYLAALASPQVEAWKQSQCFSRSLMHSWQVSFLASKLDSHVPCWTQLCRHRQIHGHGHSHPTTFCKEEGRNVWIHCSVYGLRPPFQLHRWIFYSWHLVFALFVAFYFYFFSLFSFSMLVHVYKKLFFLWGSGSKITSSNVYSALPCARRFQGCI